MTIEQMYNQIAKERDGLKKDNASLQVENENLRERILSLRNVLINGTGSSVFWRENALSADDEAAK